MSVQTDEPPVEWVYLQNPNSNVSEDEQADGYCNFIGKFYWREREGQQNELHITFNSDGCEKRYKYYGVKREVYNEAWNRAHNPNEFRNSFGSWFNNIEGRYNYDKYE